MRAYVLVYSTARSDFVPVCMSGREVPKILSKIQQKVVIRHRIHAAGLKMDYSEKSACCNCLGGGSTNSVEDRGQREWGSGGGSPLVRGSGGSCNLVQEMSFHIAKFS